MKKYTIEEIKKLKEERIILLCGKYIYDVTDYIELHPIGTSHILNNINVCIFSRKNSSFSSLLQKSKIYYNNRQLGLLNNTNQLNNITNKISFYLIPRNPMSSTNIRNNLANNTYL